MEGVEDSGACDCGCCDDKEENADTDVGAAAGDGASAGLGLKKGEEVGVRSLPNAPNPDAGLNAEGVVTRLPNAPPPPVLGPKGEADGVDGMLVSVPVPCPKGEVSGEDDGEMGRASGFAGVWGVSSSLAGGELSLKEGKDWSCGGG